MPSGCTWSLFEGQVPPHDFGLFVCHQYVRGLSLKDKCHLTILASSCAISMYVVSLFEGQVPPHDFDLFMCHQGVCGLALRRTSATSRFRPLHVPSVCTWSCSPKDKCHLTISTASCAIRVYVVSLFEGQVPPHDFGFFVCHQEVRGLAL